MSNAGPWVTGNGIVFNLYRAKLSAPMGKDYLFELIGGLFGHISISSDHGRHGYKHTAVIDEPTGNQLARLYWGHQTATPCIDFIGIPSRSPILSKFRASYNHEVTAISATHLLSYLSFDKLTSMCSRSITLEQGGVSREVIFSDSVNGRTISYSRNNIKIIIDSVTNSLTISTSPSGEFRKMLADNPIRGIWSCAYWTRHLFNEIFRQGDPQPSCYSHLLSEQLRLPPENTLE